jgi:5-deoxy-glucuronate isomerase
VQFEAVRIGSGTAHNGDTRGNEVILVFIEGTANVTSPRGSWDGVGGRASPFEGPPQAIYLPPHTQYRLSALTDCEVAICGAAVREAVHPPRLLQLQRSDAHTRGSGSAQRTIYDIVMDPDSASSLFVTEVLTPPGNWSSYPPHKHDTDDPPRESQLEEIYYYRIRPSEGFAFQRVYTADGTLDETITAHDRDTVLVPRGYHVCAAAPEYEVYYLNVLAGPKHVYAMTFDPKHEWIKEGWRW